MKGHFRKRGKTWYFTLDIGKDERGKRKQKKVGGFKTKKEAEKACAELIAQIESEGYKEPKKVTLEEFMVDYFENHVKHTIRRTTFYNQMSLVNKHILPKLGNLQLAKITPMILQRFYNEMIEQGYSASYIRGIHAIIGKTLKTATEWDYISKNVATLIKLPRVTRREINIWSMEEATRFLSLVKDRSTFIAYALAIYTGMRKGEILALRWQDCDLDKGQISVRQTLYHTKGGLIFQEPKTRGSRRTISISDYLIKCLKKHKRKQNHIKLQLGSGYQDHGLIVCHTHGTPIHPQDINRDLKRAIKKHNFRPISFHDLRHTHATMLLQLGENPKVVSERLGHSSVTITLDTYSHVLPDMQKSLAEKFDLAMKKNQKSSENTL
ncbi:site-specific integrase [Melghirimyces algeriensis]|uniref:Site-specific recombinase XerD n=1 Tax=Melghirimyces algeriensis TaxID=910412 RepID=A0A521C4D4_9BACL|nr:site-specific integrase [Melghirimyces algeriensis]SMO54268.1 Site-specific recombinase XerD [Melghirimyces algeriensis]